MKNNAYDPGYDLTGGSNEYIGPWREYECTCGKKHLCDEGFWLGQESLICLECNTVIVITSLEVTGDYVTGWTEKAIDCKLFASRLHELFLLDNYQN